MAGHTEHAIWLGDFNLHHPFQDEEQNTHLFTRVILVRSQVLIVAVAELDLQMALPKDPPKCALPHHPPQHHHQGSLSLHSCQSSFYVRSYLLSQGHILQAEFTLSG